MKVKIEINLEKIIKSGFDLKRIVRDELRRNDNNGLIIENGTLHIRNYIFMYLDTRKICRRCAHCCSGCFHTDKGGCRRGGCLGYICNFFNFDDNIILKRILDLNYYLSDGNENMKEIYFNYLRDLVLSDYFKEKIKYTKEAIEDKYNLISMIKDGNIVGENIIEKLKSHKKIFDSSVFHNEKITGRMEENIKLAAEFDKETERLFEKER